MEIELIPALSDNYIFLLFDLEQKIAAVVDPAEAKPVLKRLQQLDLQLVAIFNTHHHYDHVGGNWQLLEHFPDLCIYGGSHDRGRIPGQHRFLEDGDRLEFAGRVGEVFYIPGHTQGHIAYYFRAVGDNQTGELFCGDTIFAGGCGRLIEGTAEQMVQSLTRLRSLPESTRIWCAHEYTLKNLAFALTVEANNPQLQQRYQQVQALRKQKIATIPSLLGIEKQTNPFLRWDTPAVQKNAASDQPVTVFAHIRKLKDHY
ncbi:MAG: hydroxyacylglutathione hydrolase [Gloeocapsa sp. DLM2.Bin57]|nr:MAG: hydroxyacylglutathione hydrolase [Gloeocapsa sp. DLM2.Bin57]